MGDGGAMATIQRTIPGISTVSPDAVRRKEIITAFRDCKRVLRQDMRQGAPDERLAFACGFTAAVAEAYWQELQQGYPSPLALPPLPSLIRRQPLTESMAVLADNLGAMAARLDPVEAGYQIGELYTSLLPDEHRSRHGIYYTPPALTARLLDLVTSAGVQWATCRVLDPACGGGAFLTPVALKIVDALGPCAPAKLLEHISQHVHGFEIDPFGAWMSQALLETALLDVCQAAGRRLPPVVTVCDSLEAPGIDGGFDLVIGNPPYGRITLSPTLRRQYARSLYGHANLYGVFTDLAVRATRPGGVIAYVTPTSFLGGQYFKALRSVLAREAPPVAIDLIMDRKGVFADVLQETLLAIYHRDGERRAAPVHVIATTGETSITVEPAGSFMTPEVPGAPWLLPRAADQTPLIARMRAMSHRLRDYDYQVSTGPLVWNRHKAQLRMERAAGDLPLIWAEAVTPDGAFVYRATKKNHAPFFAPRPGDEWLITQGPCVLVQRTTAKEQRRRLIAAELPEEFIRTHGGVVIENHLNMVRPIQPVPRVSPRVVAALLNSSIVDAAFRCINGSVAVSASELEALPLPDLDAIACLERVLHTDISREILDQMIRDIYIGREMA